MSVLTIDFQSPTAHQDFYQSLKDTGFAVLTHHPLNNALLKQVHDEWREFYHSGKQHDYPWVNDTQEGYAPFRTENAKGTAHKNLMEFFNVYAWSLYPEEVSGNALKLHNNLGRIAATLLGWLDGQLPDDIKTKLSMPLAKMVEGSSKHLMRVIHYPPLSGEEHPEEVRAAEHFDSNLLTVLPAPSMPGLQVKNSEGQWLNVDYTTGDIVINTGDMMTECTQGHLRATAHRVINPEGEAARKERMSTPLFVHPRDDVRLSARYTARQFSREYLRANGVLD